MAGERKPLVNGNGYTTVYMPEHPRADRRGRVLEHIVVFEKAAGLMVPAGCCVHHLNGDKGDNRPENLCMMEHSAHTAYHNAGKTKAESTRTKISEKAKARLADKRNHPSYKEVDVCAMKEMCEQGCTVQEICQAFGISRSTYYKKMEE